MNPVHEEILRECYAAGYKTKGNKAFKPDGKEVPVHINNRGYYYFSYKGISIYLHRLLALEKYGVSMFWQRTVVKHKNGIVSDNTYNNIILGTRSDIRKTEHTQWRKKTKEEQKKCIEKIKNHLRADRVK